MATGTTSRRGRALSVFLERIVSDIGAGRYQRGGFVPSTRELAELYGTSAETARRGLKLLQSQGVLTAEGRTGFRVAQLNDDRTCRPVAFVTGIDPAEPQVQAATAAISLAFQAAGSRRGWPLLGAYAGGDGASAVAAQLRGSNTWGVVLDTINEELSATVADCGLPTVMVNSWVENSSVSTVLQDNYRGGFLAAEHLLARGARRVAWVGPASEFCHSRERFAGAGACLRAAGRDIDRRDCLESGNDDIASKLDALLGRDDRPDGILAFGESSTAAVKSAADRRNLAIGHDLELVSWVAEECYESHYLPVFRGGAAAPAIVWSAASMTERALSLLADVGDGHVHEPVRLLVSTRLKFES